MEDTILYIVFSLLLLFLFRLFLILHRINYSYKHVARYVCGQTVSVMIVIGSGGHTSEMLRIVNNLSGGFTPRTFVIANNDKISAEKVYNSEKSRENKFDVVLIPRSREVLQSYFTSIFTTIYSFFYSIVVVYRKLPDVVICNGPGTCIPICISAFLFRVFFLKEIKIIFIESICRVRSLSLSGVIVYPICDYFIVQWKELSEKYPKARFLGKLV